MLIDLSAPGIVARWTAAMEAHASQMKTRNYVELQLARARVHGLAAGLLGFILSWNEFLFVLVLSGPGTQTLPVGLASLETHAGVEIAPLAAATVVSLLPVFALLPFLRKHLIKGLSLGALK